MRRDEYINVDWVPVVITQTTSRVFECNTLVFMNQGTQTVTIDGMWTLTPGQGFDFEQYPGEMITRNFDFVFTNDRLAGCKLVALCKQYLSHRPTHK